MIFKKLIWAIKRHPFLYLTRFKLLSKNSSVTEIEPYSYNKVNPKSDIPDYFFVINELIFPSGRPSNDMETVQQIGIWLQNNIKGGPGLSVPSAEALEIMLAGEGGVCSDRAQVFNNFCVINDIQVREWGSTRGPFNKTYGGHSFNEVFIGELNGWVLVDISYTVLFYDTSEKPLSVIALYQLMRNNEIFSYKSFNPHRELNKEGIQRNYLNQHTTPFLICNYSNKTYDTYLKYARSYVPIFVIHFIIFMMGKSYDYRFPLDDYRKIFS